MLVIYCKSFYFPSPYIEQFVAATKGILGWFSYTKIIQWCLYLKFRSKITLEWGPRDISNTFRYTYTTQPHICQHLDVEHAKSYCLNQWRWRIVVQYGVTRPEIWVCKMNQWYSPNTLNHYPLNTCLPTNWSMSTHVKEISAHQSIREQFSLANTSWVGLCIPIATMLLLPTVVDTLLHLLLALCECKSQEHSISGFHIVIHIWRKNSNGSHWNSKNWLL